MIRPISINKGMCFLWILLFFFQSFDCLSKPLEVPPEIEFAGIRLLLSPGLRRQIEAEVANYERLYLEFGQQIDQISRYLQWLDDYLIQEGLPGDYKYLALYKLYYPPLMEIPERGGFWHLSRTMADSFQLKINQKVDERYNLAASTFVTSTYLRRNNLYFRNWLLNTLTLEDSFQEVRQYVRNRFGRNEVAGVRQWHIDEQIPPLIREFLAFKIYIDQQIKQRPAASLEIMMSNRRISFQQLARRQQIELTELKRYNTWLKTGYVPGDKSYPVILPRPQSGEFLPSTPSPRPAFSAPEERLSDEEFVLLPDDFAPLVSLPTEAPAASLVNQALPLAQWHEVLLGQDLYQIARLYQLSVYELRQWNQLPTNESIFPGQILRLVP
ncbi:MAG: LysM peptidoglycan-binding domain-containing protein, partial [Microscillaceae bacterium]|nr:LysM peptidoglycan-binding domain-containing protein [Microscillaceae bacterium]